MKAFLIVLMGILLSAVCIADIGLSDLNDEYYIGEFVNINATLESSNDISGFLILRLTCEDSSTEYYRRYFEIDKDQNITIVSNPIRLQSKIANKDDECYILAKFVDQVDEQLMSKKSDKFDVIFDFNVSTLIEDTQLLPGDTLVIDVEFETPVDIFSKVFIDLIVDKKLSRYEFENKTFSIEYVLPSNIKSGEQEIIMQIEDDMGNDVEIEKTMTVIGVETSISNMFSRKVYYANEEEEKFSFKPVLYDQGLDEIDDKNIVVKIVDPDDKVIALDNVMSTTTFTFELSSSMKPGDYKVISSYDEIVEESRFEILNSGYEPGNEPEEVEVEKTKNQTAQNTTLIIDLKPTSEEKSLFNIWKYLFFFLVILLILMGIYLFGRNHGKKSERFKDDKFYGMHRKSEKKKKQAHPKVIKADPKKHEED